MTLLRVRAAGETTEVEPGQILQVTEELVDVLTGAPTTPGTVVLDGRDLSRWDPPRRAKAGLVVLGDVPVSADVSILDHLAMLDRVRGKALLAEAPLLGDRPDAMAGWLSGGERQVLGWLQTVLADPRVVLLDVAGRGLDQPTLRWASGVIGTWLADGVAVLVHAGRAEEEHWVALHQ